LLFRIIVCYVYYLFSISLCSLVPCLFFVLCWSCGTLFSGRVIRRDLHPGEGLAHNEGQPKQAPHASKSSTTAKFLTNCAEEHAASLKCIEQNYHKRSACQPFFDNYKQCRKDENARRLEANAGKGGDGGWFW
jgi:hypothetical protein